MYLFSVSIKWKEKHVKGSPFSVLIAESAEQLNTATNGKFHKKVMNPPVSKKSPDFPQINVPQSSKDQLNIVTKQDSLSESSDSEKYQNVATAEAVLQRSSKLHRSLSKVSGPELSKHGTVRRRRVLKQIVTKEGKEIVIHEASPLESATSEESVGELSQKGTPPVKYRRIGYLDAYPKSFDFQGSFESDSSIFKDDSTPKNGEVNNELEMCAERIAKSILKEVLENVFRTLHYNEYLRITKMKQNEFLREKLNLNDDHLVGSKRFMFGREKRFQSTGNLNIPTFEKQYQASHLTDFKDIPDATEPVSPDNWEQEASLYRNKRRLRFSEPSLDSLATSIDSEAFSNCDSKTTFSAAVTDDEEPCQYLPASSDSSDSSKRDVSVTTSDSTGKSEGSESHQLITVHTQLKGNNPRPTAVITASNIRSTDTSHDVDGTSNKYQFPVSMNIKMSSNRKTFSEPNTPAPDDDQVNKRNIFARSFSHEAYLRENSEISVFSDKGVMSPGFDENDDVFVGNSSPLKLLTSQSMQKSCVYISRKPVEMSVDSVDLHQQSVVSGGNIR